MLVKATLTQLSTLETFTVLWNPTSYSLWRTHRLAAPAVLGAAISPAQVVAGGSEKFATRLFFDSTEKSGSARSLRGAVELLEAWAEPEAQSRLPPHILFTWGPFRFRGVIEELRQEWVRFDPDGTPVRGWVDLVLGR